MANQKNTEEFKFDGIKWCLIALLAVGAIFANYHYSTYSTPIKLSLWIGWFVVVIAIARFTNKGSRAILFFSEAKSELNKVHWPEKNEVVQITLVIILVVCIIGLLLWLVDSGLLWAVGKITQLSG